MTAAPDSRRRILSAALARFLEDGYDGTTIARIRQDAGVSNGTLFHHFRSKDAIAAALSIDSIKDFQQGHWKILGERPATLRAGIGAIVAHHLSWVQGHPDQARFLYQSGRLDPETAGADELFTLNAELIRSYTDWYCPMIRTGEARQIPVGLVFAIVTGPSHAISRQWLRGTRERDLTRHTDELAHAAWAGLAGPAALAAAAGQPPPTPPDEESPRPSRMRVELLADDGTVLGATLAELEFGSPGRPGPTARATGTPDDVGVVDH